jgi:hypothetical protein
MKYECDVCNFSTNRKPDWERHVKSKKHSRRTREYQDKQKDKLIDTLNKENHHYKVQIRQLENKHIEL